MGNLGNLNLPAFGINERLISMEILIVVVIQMGYMNYKLRRKTHTLACGMKVAFYEKLYFYHLTLAWNNI